MQLRQILEVRPGALGRAALTRRAPQPCSALQLCDCSLAQARDARRGQVPWAVPSRRPPSRAGTQVPGPQCPAAAPRAGCGFPRAPRRTAGTSSGATPTPPSLTRGSRAAAFTCVTPGLDVPAGLCLWLPVSHFPLLFILMSLMSSLPLNTLPALWASGLKAATQTLEDQIKIEKKKKSKIFPFQMEEQMGLLALARI